MDRIRIWADSHILLVLSFSVKSDHAVWVVQIRWKYL